MEMQVLPPTPSPHEKEESNPPHPNGSVRFKNSLVQEIAVPVFPLEDKEPFEDILLSGPKVCRQYLLFYLNGQRLLYVNEKNVQIFHLEGRVTCDFCKWVIRYPFTMLKRLPFYCKTLSETLPELFLAQSFLCIDSCA